MRPFLVSTAGVVGVGIAGAIDYVTGNEVRVFPLYFLPVALVAWRISRTATVMLSLLSTAMWGLANLATGRSYHMSAAFPINLATQFVSFATVGVLVAELQRRLRHERELSRVDALTGLANPRAFYERGELLIALARRAGRPITLAYLDLDNFKWINDQRGHHEGDLALSHTAALLRANCRSTDLVARLGGDEFAVLLPDTNPDAAMIVLERLRLAIVEMMNAHAYPCAASVGAVAYLRAPATLEVAVHDADELMYRAKGAGKNRVVLERIEAPAAAVAPPAVEA